MAKSKPMPTKGKPMPYPMKPGKGGGKKGARGC